MAATNMGGGGQPAPALTLRLGQERVGHLLACSGDFATITFITVESDL